MRKLLTIASLISCALISACGVGSGDSGGSTAEPSINVVLSATSGSASVIEGATRAAFSASATGMPSAKITTPVVTDVQFDKTVFASITVTPGTATNSYALVATTLPDLGGGDYAGNITLRLCQDATCAKVYAGSTVTYAYSLTVKLQDWATYQRNAAHTGYVHITLDPAKFVKAWELDLPRNTTELSEHEGTIFYTGRNENTSAANLYAFDTRSAMIVWKKAFASNIERVSQPTYGDGKLFVGTQSSTAVGKIYAYDAGSGADLFATGFNSQWADLGAPVYFQNTFYYTQGNGGEVYAYSGDNGNELWRAYTANRKVYDYDIPAVDESSVYYYDDDKLYVLDRKTGKISYSINDGKNLNQGYDYYSASIVTKGGYVAGYSGLASSPYDLRQIAAYDLQTRTQKWITAGKYNTVLASANGVIYAANGETAQLDAIDEKDGAILWSWKGPKTPYITWWNTHGNVVVTDNYLFISTYYKTYAISLATHNDVWSYDSSGYLYLTSNKLLLIQDRKLTSGINATYGRLTAIKL